MLRLLRWACLTMLLVAPSTPLPPPNWPVPLTDHTSYVPLVLNRPVPIFPPATESRYITKTDPATMYSYGCKLAKSMPFNQHGYSVLLFGQPWYDEVQQTHGTLLLDDDNTFAPMAIIEAAAKYWADGFWDCTPLEDSPKVSLLIGTNNYGSEVTAPNGPDRISLSGMTSPMMEY